MKITRCESNRHFYDADLQNTCPHCLKEKGGSVPDGGSAAQTVRQPAEQFSVKAPLTPVQVSAPAAPQIIVPPPEQKTPDTIFCTNCGKPMAITKQFCSNCGKKLRVPEMQPQQTPQPVEEESVPKETGGENEINQADTPVDAESAPENEKTDDFCGGESPVAGWLVCVRGEDQGKGFDLRFGQNYIVRAQNMIITIEREASLSAGKYAAIVFDQEKNAFHLQPGEGSGLIYLNGAIAPEHTVLSAYDEIQLGNAEFVFVPLCGDRFSWDRYKNDDEM